MSENPACYGHYSRNSYRDRNGNLHYTEDCGHCSLARWCKDSADEMPDRATRVNDSMPERADSASSASEEAKIIEEALVKLAQAADGSVVRMGIMLARLCGLSYEQIGAQMGTSRQAIHKHIKAIVRKNSQIGALLKEKPVISVVVKKEIKIESSLMSFYRQERCTAERFEQWNRIFRSTR